MTLTTDQQIITLKIRGDPDGTGSRTATFELESAPDSGLSVSHTIRTGFLVNDQGQLVNSILSEVLGDGESRNKGIYVDAGTSSYALIENPTLTPAEPTTFDGSLIFIEAENLGKALDAAGNSKAGSGSS